MKNYVGLQKASTLTGYSVRRLQQLCAKGTIEGVVFSDGQYLIPSSALESLYKKDKASSMPIGLDFVETVASGSYVDKTLLIRDIVYSHTKTTIFCRPRRFGKSLNMQMLWRYFECTEDPQDQDIFANLDIEHFREINEIHRGKYSVLYLRFKDLKYDDFPSLLSGLKGLLYAEYIRNSRFIKPDNPLLLPYAHWAKGDVGQPQLESFLATMSEAIMNDSGKKSVIIIDEFDTPILHAYGKGYYAQAIAFFRNFLSAGMKDNPYLAFAFLSGITPLGKESIFSGFNSAKVNTVLDIEYANYFGFTAGETKALLRRYGGYRHYPSAKAAYDGYQFGSTEVFNPWSIANFINSSYRLDDYWRNSADNSFLANALQFQENEERLSALLSGQSIQDIPLDMHQDLASAMSSVSGIWTVLLCAGYITLASDGGFRIPNAEVRKAFQLEILPRYGVKDPSRALRDFTICLNDADAAGMETLLKDFLKRSVSYLLVGKEDFYHGFMLGISFFLAPYYQVHSEYERGDGRSDLFLSPKNGTGPCIVLEVKQGNHNKQNLDELAEEGLKQIAEKGYDYGYKSSIRFGIAFRGKDVCVVSSIHAS